MEVTFNDKVRVTRGGKDNREESYFKIEIEKCEKGIRDISLYDSSVCIGGFIHFKTIEEWDKLKNAMDRLIIKAQDYSL